MKKLFCILSSILLAFTLLVGNVNASEISDNSYSKIKEYYEGLENTEITKIDEVLAIASLGLDLSNYKINDYTSYDFSTLGLGDLSKVIILFSLMGYNPRDINGKNPVEVLESYIQTDGSIVNASGYTQGNNIEVYVLYALYSVNSTYCEIVADHLVSTADENKAYGYGYGSSADITSWVVEVLYLINSDKYSEPINNAITYIKSKMSLDGENSGWDLYGYGYDCNTQASVLQGLFVADKASIDGNTYHNPFTVLTSFQNDQGSFGYQNKTYNNFATLQAAQALGTYYNGSVYALARNTYDSTMDNLNQNQTQPSTPVINTTPITNETGVPTGDNSNLFGYLFLILSSGYILLRKVYFEKDCK